MSLATRLGAVLQSIGTDVKALLAGLAGKYDKTGGAVTGDMLLVPSNNTSASFAMRTGAWNRVSLSFNASEANMRLGNDSGSYADLKYTTTDGLSLGAATLRSTANPTHPDHFTRRGYVDSIFGNVPTQINLISTGVNNGKGIIWRVAGDTQPRASATFDTGGFFALRMGPGNAAFDWGVAYERSGVARVAGALRNSANPVHADDYTRKAYVDTAVANAGGGISLSYDARATLRTTTPANGTRAWVRQLGSFVYDVGSSQLDDDETAFRTSGGCWLLTVPDMDLIMAYKTMELDELRGDMRVSVADQLANRFIATTFNQSTSIIAASGRVTTTATIAGALLGAHVVITPPVGTTVDLNFYANVTAADTVLVTIMNLRTASAFIPTGAWPILVINPPA